MTDTLKKTPDEQIAEVPSRMSVTDLVEQTDDALTEDR